MENFFTEWGVEIVLAICTTGSIALAKWFHSQIKKYKSMIKDQEKEDAIAAVDAKLEPIYQELEDLRDYVRNTAITEKSHMNLIVASWRFRLIQLCKEILPQGYITQMQYDQLTEFYRLYEGMGGNGQAKDYYDRAMSLPLK